MTPSPIAVDAEFTEVPQRGLQVVPDGAIAAVGVLAIADLTDVEFDRRLASLEKGRDRTARIQKALMKQDVDYGTIPGTPKPTLLKPGAEKLCFAYGLVANFRPQRVLGDGLTGPNLAYQTRCDLHLGSLDGPIVAVGYGSANSWERKHRYRSGERLCPACGKNGSIIKGKAEYGGGWLCFAKKGGCGAKFGDKDPSILGQIVGGDIENPDPWDLDTTLLKMAEKRAHVDATLRGTAASGLFTQDVEDLPTPVDELHVAVSTPPRVVTQSASSARQRPSQRRTEPPEPTEDEIDSLFRDATRDSLPPTPAADPTTGEIIATTDNGLTPQQFLAMAKAHKLGTGQIVRAAKRLFPEAGELSALNDVQRGRLLDDLVNDEQPVAAR